MEDTKIRALRRDWVERIFDRLADIYGDIWISRNENPERRNLNIIQWSTGLSGLTESEIRDALAILRNSPSYHPPTAVEFYHYAKGIARPPMYKKSFIKPGNPVVANAFLNDIKSKLHNKRST